MRMNAQKAHGERLKDHTLQMERMDGAFTVSRFKFRTISSWLIASSALVDIKNFTEFPQHSVRNMSSFQPEEFPILCETCLGENPYLRMTRERFAKACKICDRPFHVFRWRPGPRARFKKTEICGTCAKLKNVCQTCILDLQYGLPVQVRDEALAKEDQTAVLQKDTLPVSHTNRNYMYEQLEQQVGLGGTNTSLQLPYDSIDAANGGNAMLQRMHRKGPYYKRNLPHICSFYVRGICNRGDACPYRHVHPDQEKQDESLKDQNIKDRFYGVNDPVAKKLMRKYNEWTTGEDDADGADPTNRKRRRELPSPPSDVNIRYVCIAIDFCYF